MDRELVPGNAGTASGEGGSATAPRQTVVFRRFRQGDEIALNALFNRVFRQQRSLAEWMWKFEGNRVASGLESQVINVAEIGSTLVGQFASITARFKISHQQVILAHGVDTAVDTEHRVGAGVIISLSREHASLLGETGALFGYGIPNTAHYKIGKRLLRYRDLCPMITLRRRLNWVHTIRRRFPALPLPVMRAVAWAGGIVVRPKRGGAYPAGLTIREVARFDEKKMDALWQRASGRYGILAVRDARYLNWRYADRPGNPYTIMQAERDGSVLGFVVLRLALEGQDAVGLIMDLFTAPGQMIEPALVREALRWFADRRADYVLCSLVPHDAAVSALLACGFRDHPAFPPAQVAYAPHETAMALYPCVEDATQWHLSYGDFDTY